MPRPAFGSINSGIQGWDSTVNNNKDILANGPWPIHKSTGLGVDGIEAVTPAASYDQCIVMALNAGETKWGMYGSDGATWELMFEFA